MSVTPLKIVAVVLLAALTAPAALAGEKHRAMGVAVRWFESASPRIGDALAVRLSTHLWKSYEGCQATLDRWNARRKARTSNLGNPFKIQAVCYKASFRDSDDITMDICGRPGLLYRRTCTFLLYKKPSLEQYKPGEWIRFQ